MSSVASATKPSPFIAALSQHILTCPLLLLVYEFMGQFAQFVTSITFMVPPPNSTRIFGAMAHAPSFAFFRALTFSYSSGSNCFNLNIVGVSSIGSLDILSNILRHIRLNLKLFLNTWRFIHCLIALVFVDVADDFKLFLFTKYQISLYIVF